jgi:hypothetical protein
MGVLRKTVNRNKKQVEKNEALHFNFAYLNNGLQISDFTLFYDGLYKDTSPRDLF